MALGLRHVDFTDPPHVTADEFKFEELYTLKI